MCVRVQFILEYKLILIEDMILLTFASVKKVSSEVGIGLQGLLTTSTADDVVGGPRNFLGLKIKRNTDRFL